MPACFCRLLLCCIAGLAFIIEPVAGQDVERRAIVINELHYRPAEPALEFVELYNRSSRPVDLSAFQISDDRMNPVPITPETHYLAPQSYAVLVRNTEVFAETFPGVEAIEPPSWPILRQTGDASVLYHGGEVIDSVGYEPGWGGFEREHSLERIDPDGPSHHQSNFATSLGPPTPGARNSVFAPNIEPPHPAFVAAEVSNVQIYFDEPIDPHSVRAEHFMLQNGSVPDAIHLYDQDTRIVLEFGEPVSGKHLSIDGIRDLSGNYLTESSAPIAFPPSRMVRETSGDLVINEILYAPQFDEYDGEPDQVEYIELLNTGNRLLNLTGLHRTGRTNQYGETDTTWFAADQLALAPGEFALIHATRDHVDLRDAFPEFASALSEAVLIPHPRVQLGLRASGDLVRLHRSDGAVIDSVAYHPEWHHSQLEDTRGIALERIWAGGAPSHGSNWTSSLHPHGGTPAATNSTRHDPDIPSTASEMNISPLTFAPGGGGAHHQAAISYRLDSDDALVRIRIFDSMGRLVRRLEPARAGGRFEDAVLWDGRNENGNLVRLGIYVVHLEAVFYDQSRVETLREPVVVAAPF